MSEWEVNRVEYVPIDPDIGAWGYEVHASLGVEHRQTLEEKLSTPLQERLEREYQQATATLLITPDVRIGRFEVSSLTVHAKDVTGVLIRSMPLQRITEEALSLMAARGWPGLRPMRVVTEEQRSLWPKEKGKVAPLISVVYTDASIRGLPPVEAVAAQFQVAKRTATRMIAHARETGWLTIDPVHTTRKGTSHGTGETGSGAAG